MRKMVIMRGVSGSGKSTWVREAMEADRWGKGARIVVVSADFYWDEHPFSPSRLPEAHAWCRGRAMRAAFEDVGKGLVLIVDNTNTRFWEFRDYVAMARFSDMQIEVVELLPADLGAVIDCAQRNIHKVPVSTVVRQWEHWEKLPDLQGVYSFAVPPRFRPQAT